tara:strand:+ start:404 stop:562 length:159 start_codon:yes stop_codon:yes gene_type:complete
MKFVIESIPFSAKVGWVVETIPMFKREAEALHRLRLANNTGKNRRRYRLTKV